MMTNGNRAETWYEATADRGSGFPALESQIDADVCVIGAGLAGLTTALELARRGQSVVLLEAERIAWGASGRNGGFVSHGFAEGLNEIRARLGLDAARELFRLSCFGTEYVRREIAEGDPTIRMGDGWLSLIRYDNAAEKQGSVRRAQEDYGRPLRYLPTEETRKLLASRRYFQGALDPEAFHMHPLRYALMIAEKARKAGVRIFEKSRALSLANGVAKTAAGEVRAKNIVLCVSSLDRSLHQPTGRAVLPVATYVAVTEALKQDAIRTHHAISDSRRAGNYYRLIDEGRILWGGAITTRVSEPMRLASRMKADMLSVFPQLGDPRIDYAWAGLMGYALHKMPLIGTDGRGIWWALAFGGHGMNTTAMAGLLLGRAIAAGDDEYRRFAPYSLRWVGGPFGRIGVQSSYWWMQVRDWRDERRSA